MSPEFILIGKHIKFNNKGKLHYVSAKKLVELYQLSNFKCHLCDEEADCKDHDVNPYQITLKPRRFNDYLAHKKARVFIWSKIAENKDIVPKREITMLFGKRG